MPEKSGRERASRAKARGATMTVKDSAGSLARGKSPHAAKKSSSVRGARTFRERSVSAKATPGHGLTRTGRKVPLPETGSSGSRRRTLPSAAAARQRKSGRSG